jgi:hypothetical protein
MNIYKDGTIYDGYYNYDKEFSVVKFKGTIKYPNGE